MNSELQNFINVWIVAITGLCYCYFIASKLPKGMLRLLSLLPIFCLFVILPLKLTSIHLTVITAFFLVWLATFKLLLLSFDQGPLYPPPPNVFQFISIACLPIKHNPQPNERSGNVVSGLNVRWTRLVVMTIKIVILVCMFHSYNYREHMHPYVLLAIYCFHLYLELELVLAICATPASAYFSFQLEQQFHEPYLATSLQDFWGRRWNLMVTSILRPTVYNPIKHLLAKRVGPIWSRVLAMIAAFVVSGLMHEVIFYYVTRTSPTWEIMLFFVLHGVCLAIEMMVKKALSDKWKLNRGVSTLLTLAFMLVTGVRLFFPQLIRNHLDDKAIGEYSILVDFAKRHVKRILDFH